jgi:hypothetical protein
MKTEVRFTKYNDIEFTPEDLEGLKSFIINQLKDQDRITGITFLYKGIIFSITSIGYDVEQNIKIIFLTQITTSKNPVIQKPKLELAH